MGSGSTFWGSEGGGAGGGEGGGGGAISRSTSPGPVLPISRTHSPLHTTSQASSAASGGWAPKSNGYAPAGGARKFLGKHLRKLSTSLPSYNRAPFTAAAGSTSYYRGSGGFRGVLTRRPRLTWFLLLLLAALAYVFLHLHHNPLSNRLRGVSGGSKFVIILAANQGGGVMTWKGAKEWAVERDSIANKKAYAERWGYHLEIKDMSTKKRYAHEWRESWEKVDVIKQTMRQYPKAEW
jgi:mannan polymerase II complex MNN10 subunit